MRDLLESKDILSEPRVVAAARGLGVNLHDMTRHYSGFYGLKSLADAAFAMRDAAMEYITEDILRRVSGVQCKAKNYVYWWWFQFAKPEDDIVAATLAWEAGQ